MMNKFFHKNKTLGITILLAISIIAILFTLKGIYPFGKNTVNIIDFDSAYIPVYYKLWDLLHGKGSVLFDWNLGAGLNCYGSLIMNALISPFSLIIGLFSRDNISYGISFVLILKLIFINVCTFITINKLFPKIRESYKCIFTLIYSFSGWTFLMFSNIQYLEVVGLFPLFVLAYYRLMYENKSFWYVIILTICLLLNYYMSWMILFFIIGITIFSLLFLDITDKRKKAVKVFLLTLLSLGISCCLFLPSFYQSITSYRLNSNDYSNSNSLSLFFMKLIYLIPSALLFVLTFKQLCIKKDKKINLFIGLMLLYLLVGLFIEPINALWHTGSYSGFPYRYSYIIIFSLCLSSLYYLNNNYVNKKKDNILNIIATFSLIILFIVMYYLLKDEITKNTLAYMINYVSQMVGLLVLFIILIITFVIVFKNSIKWANIFICLFSFIIIILFGNLYIQNANKDEVSALITQNVYDSFELKNDGYNYSDLTQTLSINFPYILDVPSMENRLHIIKDNEINFSEAFGYGITDTIIYAKGGTLLTNLLMQNKYYFSNEELNPELFKLIEYKDNIFYYESKYNLNYIVPYSGNKFDLDYGSLIENNNVLYKTLFDKDTDIMHKVDYEFIDNNYVFDVEPGKIYYLNIYPELYESINFDFTKNNVNFEQISFTNTNIIISFYTEEKTKVKINKSEYKVTGIELGYIDIKEYIDFVKKVSDYNVQCKIVNNKKKYDYDAKEDGFVLLPINYDEGLKIKINGKEVDYELNVLNMVSVKVNKGVNEIVVSYEPKYFKEGIYISLGSLLLWLIIYITDKKFKYLDNKFILNILFGIVCLLGSLFILRIYILSWLF